MKLVKMFELQRKLDDHIIEEHSELKGQEALPWKILALQVELGECCNEWRGFKKWSYDQEPRTKALRYPAMMEEDKEYYNPMLEEFVDALHFVLSIGLELADEWVIEEDYEVYGFIKEAWNNENTIEQFQVVYRNIAEFSSDYNDFTYVELVSQFLGLGEMLGFSWTDIENAYISKNNINHIRQDSNY